LPFSLYDVTVPSFIQSADALVRILDKAKAHFEAAGIDPDSVTGIRFAPDMKPLHYQVQSAGHHAVEALRGLRTGVCMPPKAHDSMTYAQMRAMAAQAALDLRDFTAEEVNGLTGSDIVFRLWGTDTPYLAEDFLLTFSMPNVYFHVATAYDLLRNQGVPLGKKDFLGWMRIKKPLRADAPLADAAR